MLLSLLFFLSLTPSLSLNQEGLYLQRVKLSLHDPDGYLTNWNDRDNTPCNWYGIVCDSATRSVNSVDLSNTHVAGPFPSLLCRLHNLNFISLSNNFINSSLPLDIFRCQNLEYLNLSHNYLTGALPVTLANLNNLRYLNFTGNNFSGNIPESFGRFRKLEVLSLVKNLLNGTLPSFLGNITTLKKIELSYNPFAPGRIPPELGNLTLLEVLCLNECRLMGPIPDSLGKLKRLTELHLARNSLEGPMPGSLTELRSVVQIDLSINSLSGEFPPGMSNLTALRQFNASMNQLEGRIPDELTQLPLESLYLYKNRLVGNLPESIANSPHLYDLRLFRNSLTGELPKDLGKNSPLLWLDVSSNQFSGEIPANLCGKGILERLLIKNNSFSGQIPESLSKCRSLTRVRLGKNNFSGEVPVGFWGLPYLNFLELNDNSFSGQIAKTIARAVNLSHFNISRNNFSGVIPDEIGQLKNLINFLGSDNRLIGLIPVTIVKLGQLGRLDLHNNDLSGELPNGIQSWKKLSELNLANNEFSGKIPEEIGSLSVLNYLDLSGNHFSGKIPLGLQKLKLTRLNLSNNQLSGDIPRFYVSEIYRSSFLGNPELCGNFDGPCDGGGAKNQGYLWSLGSFFILASIAFMVVVVWFYWKYKNSKKSKKAIDKSKWTSMRFHILGFSEYEILDCLNEDNVIGSGASGKVFKAILSNGDTVAVKKLWGGSKTEKDDGFETEVDTMGKIRHKNIVKLWCCFTTRGCKLLVYEYMPNGSLGDLLHSSEGGRLLHWQRRYKIAVDAAEGLSYLHHNCVPPIVHRDVKSNNILLDGDFGARVADFGVAKVVDATGKEPKSMSVIVGSCGYIAPEYAYTLRVNEKSDIYSFGVVILELVTGRLPIDPEFGEKDLVKWVCTSLDQRGVDRVIDPKLDTCFKEEICKVLNIGLLCTNPFPINRPSMKMVVKMLQEVSSAKRSPRTSTLSPYYCEDDQGSVV